MGRVCGPIAWVLTLISCAEFTEWRSHPGLALDASFSGSEGFVLDDTMVQAWERRYYKQSDTTGLEVMLVRRASPGKWVVVLPDRSLRIAPVGGRALRTAPDSALIYSPLPVINSAQREELTGMAITSVAAGTLTELAMPPHSGRGHSRRVSELKRFLSVVFSMPLASARWVRWGLRSRSRFSGLMAVTFLIYEGLTSAGAFDRIQYIFEAIYQFKEGVRNRIEDVSETGADFFRVMDEISSAIREWVEPWRLLAYASCGAILWWATSEIQEGSWSPTSSPGASPTSSPGSTPPASPRAERDNEAMRALTEAFSSQQKVIARMEEQQRSLTRMVGDMATERRTRQLLQESGAPSSTSTAALDEIKRRLVGFENILRQDRGEAAGSGPPGLDLPGPVPPLPTPSTLKQDDPEVAAGGPLKSPTDVGEISPDPKAKHVAEIIHRLKKESETPQEVFVKHLEQYRPEDPEDWARHFPPGYRERLAAVWLGEVFRSGLTPKQWAKNWVKDKGLGECDEARDLIPTMAALEAILLSDRQPDCINSVALEKLARRGYGICRAFQRVSTVADWRKPKDAKGWKTRVDYETWKRLDPSRLSDDDHLFVNRRVENEVREEMDRDAAMMKARAKLADASRGPGGE
jgi:hypothetical protein